MLFGCVVAPKGFSLPDRAAHWMRLHCFHAIQVKEGAGLSPLERVVMLLGAFLRHTAGKMPPTAVDEFVRQPFFLEHRRAQIHPLARI